jgi:ADP-ribose pyrophosphatase YjhB (NUDIX family)
MDRLKTEAAIAALMEAVPEPSQGLPDNVFYYISRTTPLVNVDLLIKDEKSRTLLSWRDDPLSGKGWHIPGGIIRFKETFSARVRKVAETEIGTDLTFDPEPIALHQVIMPEYEVRGHFISLLFRCFLPAAFQPANEGLFPEDRGFLAWHVRCPDNLIPVHEIYRPYIDVNPKQRYFIPEGGA